MEYLLDTDWIAGYLRATPAFVPAIDDRRAAGIAMSVVTLAELFSGVSQSSQPQKAEDQLRRFARGAQILGIDERIARIWGEQDTHLTRTGRRLATSISSSQPRLWLTTLLFAPKTASISNESKGSSCSAYRAQAAWPSSSLTTSSGRGSFARQVRRALIVGIPTIGDGGGTTDQPPQAALYAPSKIATQAWP